MKMKDQNVTASAHISNAHFVKDIYLYENIFAYTNSI